MGTSLSRQTTAPHCNGILRLSGKSRENVVSPYFQMADLREEAPDRDTNILAIMLTAYISGYGAGYPLSVSAFLYDTTGANTFGIPLDVSITNTSTIPSITASVITAVNTYCTSQGIPLPDAYTWLASTPDAVAAQIAAAIPPAPSSYQTIVSQTGTAAPAVSGSLVPTSTYPSGTTFTWARTSAGVYTLTASTAVFNTSGKTAVFVGPVNNLNGALTAVVTSSTVITITTAVQSLAVLGLLGFTATPTDALLTKAMVYVQTYV